MTKRDTEQKTKPFNSSAFLRTIAKGRTLRTYKKNETLFAQGDDANSVFYVQKGRVKLTIVSGTVGKR
jgi:CRP/FNR family cyclic AMP-dependent transcriptional regulator